jgi:hypothetical protein
MMADPLTGAGDADWRADNQRQNRIAPIKARTVPQTAARVRPSQNVSSITPSEYFRGLSIHPKMADHKTRRQCVSD